MFRYFSIFNAFSVPLAKKTKDWVITNKFVKLCLGDNFFSLLYCVQEAEIRAKNTEEEMLRLQKSLEERNGQLQASASSSEKVLLFPFHTRSLLISVCYLRRSFGFGA